MANPGNRSALTKSSRHPNLPMINSAPSAMGFENMKNGSSTPRMRVGLWR